MIRPFIAITLALSLALGAAASAANSPAFAQAAAEAPKAAANKPAATKTAGQKLAPGQKLCKSKQPSGATKSWTCGKEQPCCVNHTMNLYTCGSQLLKCF